MSDTPRVEKSDPPIVGVDKLFEALYAELHSLAHRQLRRNSGSRTLNTTALVHEVYLRVAADGRPPLSDSRHFLAYAANAMRSVVVDIIRARNAVKRGGGRDALTLNTQDLDAPAPSGDDIVRIHDALLELADIDQTLVQVVEMRYFAGLTEGEIAATMQLSTRTVRRHWQKARLYLRASIDSSDAGSASCSAR